MRYEQPGIKPVGVGTEGDQYVAEFQPVSGQRKPDLEHALLGAEEESVPTSRGVAPCPQPFPLFAVRNFFRYTRRQRSMDLSIDTEPSNCCSMTHRGCAVALTVRNASHHAGRPDGLTVRARENLRGLDAEIDERPASTGS